MSIIRPAIEARAGMSIDDVDTPALLLDLDRFERNAERLLEVMRANGVGWRPHSKAHKSPVIARMQLGLGAHGVTCAKVSEAEIFVDAGIDSVLIAYEPATAYKWSRIAALQPHAEVIACVDPDKHVALASAAASEAGVEIPILVEVDVGMDRCGITHGQPALDLARRVADAPGLRLAGIMGYEGQTLTIWPGSEKKTAIREALTKLTGTADLIRGAGLPVDIVSGGGSGSFDTAATVPGMTELQAGGACLMDRFYGEEAHLEELGFEYALTVVGTVGGRETPDRALVDAGHKSMSERPDVPPRLIGLPDVTVLYLSAEHANLKLGPNAPDVNIGDRVSFIPDYSDSTTFRHDAFVAHRGGLVEAVIPLEGRGRLT
jgi:D-serine deaminase-like pyridoxal phosphate-dependent protein